MSFSDFMLNVPTTVRLILFVIVIVGASLLCLKVFYKQIINLAQEPPHEEGKPYVPATYYLSGRIVGMTTMAFIFLAAFTLNNTWAATKAADLATQQESQNYNTSMVYARLVPAGPARDAAIVALDAYRENILNEQQSLLEQANVAGAYEAKMAANSALLSELSAAHKLDTTNSEAWGEISDAVSETIQNGADRIGYLPGTALVSVLWLVCVLGLINLAMIIVYQPAPFRRNVVLIAIAAVVTALLMFIAIEVSNPYVGGGAVKSPLATSVSNMSK